MTQVRSPYPSDVSDEEWARTLGQVVCCEVQRRSRGWFLSMVVSRKPHQECGTAVVGLGWGVETFATLCMRPIDFDHVPNERFGLAEREALREGQRALSQALRGKRSKRAAKPSSCSRAALPTGTKSACVRSQPQWYSTTR